MVCPLDTAAVTELWRLNLFSCTLPLSFVLVRCLREANVAIFAGGLVGVDKHLFQRFCLFSRKLLGNINRLDYFFGLKANCKI